MVLRVGRMLSRPLFQSEPLQQQLEDLTFTVFLRLSLEDEQRIQHPFYTLLFIDENTVSVLRE